MINIEKQIEYWKKSAVSDVDTAGILLRNNKLLNGLFFCHLTIEKVLKAHYIKTQEKLAPKTHNLILLADKSLLIFNDNQYKHLAILMRYQLEGRYPDEEILMPSSKEALILLNETKELLEWLMKEL